MAIEALRAGKHVLCEKPMALNGEEADTMIGEAERSGKIMMIAQVLRFMPEYSELIRLVRSGELGPIRSALFRRRTAAPQWGPWQIDKKLAGGGIFDLLIHDADIVQRLFGVPEGVSSSGYEDMPNGVDTITSQFHYTDVGEVTLTGGWFHRGQYPFSMEYTVVGDDGVVEFSSAGRPPTVYWPDGRQTPLAPEAKDGYQAELEYFLECCQNSALPERCLPAESSLAVKLTSLMVEAREKKGEILKCRF